MYKGPGVRASSEAPASPWSMPACVCAALCPFSHYSPGVSHTDPTQRLPCKTVYLRFVEGSGGGQDRLVFFYEVNKKNVTK